jgi:hypothetical protein
MLKNDYLNYLRKLKNKIELKFFLLLKKMKYFYLFLIFVLVLNAHGEEDWNNIGKNLA